jgi:hypothetical protein
LDNYRERITLIHLNGFEGDRDHISLDRLSQEQLRQIMNTLRAFQGTVSLEVFSFSDLTTSLDLLENSWRTAN